MTRARCEMSICDNADGEGSTTLLGTRNELGSTWLSQEVHVVPLVGRVAPFVADLVGMVNPGVLLSDLDSLRLGIPPRRVPRVRSIARGTGNYLRQNGASRAGLKRADDESHLAVESQAILAENTVLPSRTEGGGFNDRAHQLGWLIRGSDSNGEKPNDLGPPPAFSEDVVLERRLGPPVR